MGNISETIIFTYNEIHKFEYSKQQQCLRISGRPIIRVKCEDEKKHQGTQVLADANIEKPHLLYLDVENAEEFISELKSYSQIEITYNDEL
jgi:hypothetical protein